MIYHIKIGNGKNTIASFVNEHDRDVCIDALREEHPDVGEDYFNAVNNDKEVKMKLECECGQDTEFYERIVVQFIVDAEGNKEEKTAESTKYFCIDCDKEVYMGD